MLCVSVVTLGMGAFTFTDNLPSCCCLLTWTQISDKCLSLLPQVCGGVWGW